MINAEELGITQANAEEMKKSEDPSIMRFMAGEGEKLGLSDDWAYNIVSQVGNYGESFDKAVGAGSPLKIERGLNALWSKGGLQYAPPIR
jgi:general L-amino acid transport system substrate-binding protein